MEQGLHSGGLFLRHGALEEDEASLEMVVGLVAIPDKAALLLDVHLEDRLGGRGFEFRPRDLAVDMLLPILSLGRSKKPRLDSLDLGSQMRLSFCNVRIRMVTDALLDLQGGVLEDAILLERVILGQRVQDSGVFFDQGL